MMVAGSFQGTRTTGTVSVWEMACSMGHRSLMSVVPCCMSTQRASKPWRAMTSAVNPWDTESQPSVTNRPSRQICLILFGLTIAPRWVCLRALDDHHRDLPRRARLVFVVGGEDRSHRLPQRRLLGRRGCAGAGLEALRHDLHLNLGLRDEILVPVGV